MGKERNSPEPTGKSSPADDPSLADSSLLRPAREGDEGIVFVCPQCSYGLVVSAGEEELRCPRPVCGARWRLSTATLVGAYRPEGRKAHPELHGLQGGEETFALRQGPNKVGRGAQCDIVINNLQVSRQHARIDRQGSRCMLEDTGSSGGTTVNGSALQGKHELVVGDRILVGGIVLEYAVRYGPASTIVEAKEQKEPEEPAQGLQMLYETEAVASVPLKMDVMTLGRAPDRDVVLDAPLVSKKHAAIERRGEQHFLVDTRSSSGTFVNGKPILSHPLERGDHVQIGPYALQYTGDKLERLESVGSVQLDALRLTKRVAGGKVILDDVSLSISDRQFVGLLGPSGAGKSTLIDALNGLRPVEEGRVLVNDIDLYESFDSVRAQLGYVPQDDIIHRELDVARALHYAALLRLPKDTSKEEREQLVAETLEALGLSERADTCIGALSGGQRKRVSIGVELLTRPGLLFLDEPTSGLDPGTENRLMNLFRRLADTGNTIICTTHVMENVYLFDKVVVLMAGKLAFYGTPAEALKHFGIERITDLYDRLEDDIPELWQSKFRKSPEFAKHISLPHEQFIEADEQTTEGNQRAAPKAAKTRRHFWPLLSRYAEILLQDKKNLRLILAQSVIITALISLVCNNPALILFLASVSSLWFGTNNAAREIVKERAIYKRERMVGLSITDYVLSKFIVLAALCTVQCAIMMGGIFIFEARTGPPFLQFGILLLTAFSGVGLGLFVSAISNNADKATTLVPLTLLPQIILAGVIVPFAEMHYAVRACSHLVAAKWANQALEVSILEGRTIDPALLLEFPVTLRNHFRAYNFMKPEDVSSFLQSYLGQVFSAPELLLADIGIVGAFVVGFLVLTGIALKTQD